MADIRKDNESLGNSNPRVIIPDPQPSSNEESTENKNHQLDDQGSRLKIMVIGFTDVGKTTYLASVQKITEQLTKNKFNIISSNPTEDTKIEKSFKVIKGEVDNADIFTTLNIDYSLLDFKKGLNKLIGIEILDVEGQGVDKSLENDKGEMILEAIQGCDGIIIVVDTPTSDDEEDKTQAQITQVLNLAKTAITERKQPVLTLVVNKIDKLEECWQLRRVLNKKIPDLSISLHKKHKKSPQKRLEKLSKERGKITYEYIQKIAEGNNRIFSIAQNFHATIDDTPGLLNFIPSQTFLSTGYGFTLTKVDSIEEAKKDNHGRYEPYGGIASFLWTIYAILKEKETNSHPIIEKIKDRSILDTILEDVIDMQNTGKAYLDYSSKIKQAPFLSYSSQKDFFEKKDIGDGENSTIYPPQLKLI